MTTQSERGHEGHASSTGQALTGGGWLDVHFEMARHEYEAQLRMVGSQPGLRVVDAASGSESYLPWLVELVGPTGSLVALDLAPDNVALVEQWVADWHLSCPVEAPAGSVSAASGSIQGAGLMRVPQLPARMRQAGFINVWFLEIRT